MTAFPYEDAVTNSVLSVGTRRVRRRASEAAQLGGVEGNVVGERGWCWKIAIGAGSVSDALVLQVAIQLGHCQQRINGLRAAAG